MVGELVRQPFEIWYTELLAGQIAGPEELPEALYNNGILMAYSFRCVFMIRNF